MILVTGGAGYIGSHMVKMLRTQGRSVLVLDDFSTGFEDSLLGAPFVRGSIGDSSILNEIFTKNHISAVMNFASFTLVEQSVARPDAYYLNNVADTIVLLNTMQRYNVRHFIFSSTAAVYGDPRSVPICEEHDKLPINPYGRGKWMIEQILKDFQIAFDFESVSLRYFNAAGADPQGELGERHDPETHLIPLVLQVASGRRSFISVFGNDYKTKDGTCIRDYIHVQDLCSAHLLALDYLLAGGKSRCYNLGSGIGFSIKDVINAARAVTRRFIDVRYLSRRIGDPAELVADSKLIQNELNWRPQYPKLSTIVSHAWEWEQKLVRQTRLLRP